MGRGNSIGLAGTSARLALPLAALTALTVVFLPLALVLFSGLGGLSGSPLSAFSTALSTGLYREIFAFSIAQAAGSMLLTLALGLPGAYFFARYDFRWKDKLLALSTLPFVLPSVLVVLGFVIFFGNTGTLNSALSRLPGMGDVPLRVLYSWRAILLAHAFYNVPLVYRLVSVSWSHIDQRMVEAAQSVGASPWRIFRDIELPFLRHAVLSSSLLTFIYSFTSFAIILALGGPRYATVEVTVYTLSRMTGSYGLSSALALLQLAFLCGVVWLYVRIPAVRGGHGMRTPLRFSALRMRYRALAAAYGCAMGVFFFGPMAGIVHAALRQTSSGAGSYTLRWFYEILFPTGTGLADATPLSSIATSVGIGATATALSVVAGLGMAYLIRSSQRSRSLLGVLTMVPLGVSTVTLALGYLVIGSELGIDVSLAGIVLIHALISFPFSVRSIHGALSKLDPSLIEASLGMGASRLRTFIGIDLPLIKGGIAAAAVFSFALSLGELAAAYMLYGGDYVTIPIYIYRYIGGYRFGSAAAMGTVLMAVSAAAFLLIERAGSVFREG
jgi:thiamine transport system permease protein